MSLRLLTSAEDLASYDTWVKTHHEGSLWQSLEWKRYQEALGREVKIYVSDQWSESSGQQGGMTALVVIDKTKGGYSTWEIPRGPLCNEEKEGEEQCIEELLYEAKKDRCLTLYLSPAHALPSRTSILQPSMRHVQPTATRIIDLTKSNDVLLQEMHQKGRYNIKVAEKNGVTVRKGSEKDLKAFYEMLESTAERDGFVVAQQSHYKSFLTHLEQSFILIAEHEKKPIAGLVGVAWNKHGIYYYGASSYEQRHFMAPYALQWASIQHCKALGCSSYDLLGVSPEPAPKNDPWLGISDFKRKFGGGIVTYPREQMLVLRPVLKTLLDWKRTIVG